MPDSPFTPGCVVLNQGSGGVLGIVFKPLPRSAFSCLYSSFQWAKLGEKGEVTIAFSHHMVKLAGARLEELVEQLGQQKVTEIRTATRAELIGEGREPVVERILIEEA